MKSIVLVLVVAVVVQNTYGQYIRTVAPSLFDGCGCGPNVFEGCGCASNALGGCGCAPNILGGCGCAPNLLGGCGCAPNLLGGCGCGPNMLGACGCGACAPTIYASPAIPAIVPSGSVASSLADTLSLLTVSSLLAETLPLGPSVVTMGPSCGCGYGSNCGCYGGLYY